MDRPFCVEPLEPRTLFAVSLVVDYTFDTNNFFSSTERRNTVEHAASVISARLGDSLAAVTTSGSNTLSLQFTHPGNGTIQSMPVSSIPAGEVRLYVGGRELGGSTLGLGGAAGFQASGTPEFLTLVRSRGQAGATPSNPADRTDVSVLAATLTFDTTTNWHFNLRETDLVSPKNDFLSVALHEIIHSLGFAGGTPAWDNLVQGKSFLGPKSVALYGSAVPLEDDSHFEEGTKSPDGNEAAMDPTLTVGTRKLPTPLDFAALDDIGWDILPVDGEAPAPVPTAFISGNESAVAEGGSIQLSGLLSSVSTPATLTTFEWDTDYNGTTFVARATGSTLTLDLAGTDGPATRTVALRVTSSVGTQNLTTATVTIANMPPSGQLQVTTPPTGPIVATFISISDIPADLPTLTYSFDLGDDGSIEQAGPGLSYTLPFAATTNDTRTMRAFITDKDGGRRDFTTSVTLPLQPPDPIASLSILPPESATASAAVEGSQPAVFRLRLSAPIGTDLVATWSTASTDFTAGTGQVTIPAGQTEVTFSLTPIDNEVVDAARDFTVSLVGSSSDLVSLGTTEAAGTLTDTDQPITLVPDPVRARRFVAVIRGTNGDDVLNLTRDRRRKPFLTLNGLQLQPYSTSVISRVIAYLHGGNDTATLNTVGVPQFLSGGDGNDTLTSGNGRDILVGGRGADTLRSNGGEDILAAGEYGLPLIGADELLRGWIGKSKLANRVSIFADDPRSPFSATTVADSETDALRGDGSNDLFLTSETDTLFKPGKKEPRRAR